MFDCNWSRIVDQIISSYQDGMIPIIYGPTATGKTALSLQLVEKMRERYHKDVEIISADSRQVYQYMDIGTDKVDPTIRSQIIHHLIDIVTPDQIYTAGQWQQDVYHIIDDCLARWVIPMVVGGTWLYLDTLVFNMSMWAAEPDRAYRATLEQQALDALNSWDSAYLRTLLHSIDPQEAVKHHPASSRFIIRALEIYHQTGTTKSELMKKRAPKYPFLMIHLLQDTQKGNMLIDLRIDEMINRGLLEEVKWLLTMWYHPTSNALKTIDYKQTIIYLQGGCAWEEYKQSLQIAHHQLAKKQRSWFRRYDNQIEHSLFFHFLHFYLPDFVLQ